MSKYAFLRSNASLVIIGSLLGLAGGFKIANLQYHREQSVALNRNIAQATKGMPGPQAETSAILEKARANPNDADAQIEAAFQFIQIERFQEALPFLEQASKADPNDRRASAGLGLSYFMIGRFEPAIEALKRARAQGVDNPSVTSLLIGAYVKTGKSLDEAEKLYKELESLKVDPVSLSQIRADLDAAKKGKTANQGAAPTDENGGTMKPNTTLSHGPETPKIAK
ncbi:MAG TPA: tetratricopeptide repeat protein [Blastocatellia bacterium]